MILPIAFQNSYARLPERFFARLMPVAVVSPQLIELNRPLAEELGLDSEALSSADGVAMLAGNRVALGSEPLAMAYAGHQFGHFVPQLGDGRANLLGEVVGRDGRGYDLQLKGSGLTPFSRRGDGRAALGPVLREYIVGESMHALKVPTTRALAAVLTGEPVMRNELVPGAVLARVAAGHVRVGTFEYFAARQDTDGLEILADYVLARHYPELSDGPKPYGALLQAVIGRQARLIAQWMLLGFIHGVMNTDNMSISGETIDYGPCAFMESFEPDKVYSSIDGQGRYRYSNQPHAAHWNLTRLAEAMLPLIVKEEGSTDAAVDRAQSFLGEFGISYEEARTAGMRRKLGLTTAREGDAALGDELLAHMAQGRADFTQTFRQLARAAGAGDKTVRNCFADPQGFDSWLPKWQARLALEAGAGREESMLQANPRYIPRNHLVEEVIRAGMEGDFKPFQHLLQVCTKPFQDQPGMEDFAAPARPEQYVRATFCGT